jgi:hypothetical protein
MYQGGQYDVGAVLPTKESKSSRSIEEAETVINDDDQQRDERIGRNEDMGQDIVESTKRSAHNCGEGSTRGDVGEDRTDERSWEGQEVASLQVVRASPRRQVGPMGTYEHERTSNRFHDAERRR